jgi:hypothetical protein
MWIAAAQQMQYALSFNNLATATNPAANAYITDTFDPSTLDLTTLAVGGVNIGNTNYVLSNMPLATQPFSQDIDLRPAQDLIVRVTGALNSNTHQATVNFLSLDPTTGLTPADPTVGFLAPGVGGSVIFTANPKPGLTTGTTIQDSGAVVFDSNPSISTNVWSNSIDITPPTSQVDPLPATETSANFTVSWTGADVGSGLQNFSIYVSDSGGPYTEWLTQSLGLSATYSGVFGHTYSFYSIAEDNVGNVEAAKASPDTSTQLVQPTPTTTLQASASTAVPSQLVTLTATVAGPSGSATPTGSVNFLLGTASLGTQPLNASGAAMLTTALPAGVNSITAQYSGDANFTSSTSNSVSVTVAMIATTTMVTSSLSPANLGASVTFTATVVPSAAGSGLPTGTVTFSDSSTVLGLENLGSNALATYSTSSLTAGSHSISAVYSGDTVYSGSSSSVFTQTVVAPAFSLRVTPPALTIAQGQSGQVTFTVTPVGGFSSQIDFACSGLPAYSTCTFSPTNVTPDGTNTAATSMLTISTDVAATSAESRGRLWLHGDRMLALLFLGIPSLVWAQRRFGKGRGAWIPMLACGIVLGASAMWVLGCGGGGGSTMSTNTPRGTDTITVTASGGGTTQTAMFSLTVQ